MARTLYTQPIIYSAIGNSLCQGYYVDVLSNRYTDKLTAMLTADGRNVIQRNHGIAGWKVSDHIDANTASKVNAEVPNLITVELGTNDSGSVTSDQFKTSLLALINALDRTNNPVIVLLSTWGTGRDAYNQAIKDVATTTGCIYVYISDLYTDSSNNGPAGVTGFFGTSDAFHPNTVGHPKIALRIYDAVKGILPFTVKRPIIPRTLVTRQKVNHGLA